jgi:hypothetical protein
MHAAVGDQIVVRSPHEGGARDGTIVEVHGPDGSPPYTVRWSGDAHTSLVFPGPDATVQHLESAPQTSTNA